MNAWLSAMDAIDRLSYPLELWLWLAVLIVLALLEPLFVRRRP